MDMHPSTVLKLQTADMRSWQMAIWKFVANDKECVPWKPGCSAIVWFKRYTRSWNCDVYNVQCLILCIVFLIHYIFNILSFVLFI